MVKLMGFIDIVAALAIASLLVGVEVPLVIGIIIVVVELIKGLMSVLSPA